MNSGTPIGISAAHPNLLWDSGSAKMLSIRFSRLPQSIDENRRQGISFVKRSVCLESGKEVNLLDHNIMGARRTKLIAGLVRGMLKLKKQGVSKLAYFAKSV